MKTCIITFCTLLMSGAAFSQTGYADAGARSDGMGNATVTSADVFSAQNNQAAMAFVEDLSVGISTQNYFLVDGGINAFDGAFVLPTKKSGSFGISLNYTGDNTFNQSKIGFGYGRKLAENVSVGIQLDYVGTHTTEVGGGNAFTFDIGVLYKPAKSITVGARAFNPIRAKTGLAYEQELPAIINVGLSYQPAEKIIFCLEGEQNITDDLRAKLGAEYHLVEQLYLRGGYISNPSMFTCGVGLHLKNLNIDISSQFHQQLGMAPGFGLNYKF